MAQRVMSDHHKSLWIRRAVRIIATGVAAGRYSAKHYRCLVIEQKIANHIGWYLQ
jgi:hypothetical protein